MNSTFRALGSEQNGQQFAKDILTFFLWMFLLFSISLNWNVLVKKVSIDSGHSHIFRWVWTEGGQDLWRYMASLGHNKVTCFQNGGLFHLHELRYFHHFTEILFSVSKSALFSNYGAVSLSTAGIIGHREKKSVWSPILNQRMLSYIIFAQNDSYLTLTGTKS